MQTLAEIAWPTITNPLEFITVCIGGIVLIALVVQLIRTRSIAPYLGMPALISTLAFVAFTLGGMAIDLSQFPAVVATVVGFVVEVVSSGFLWPYMLALLVAHATRILGIATYDKLKLTQG